MAIIRGTTPTITMTLPFSHELIEVGYVIVRQNKNTVIEKPVSDCTCSGNTLSVKLTQEETLDLSREYNAEIDVVVKTTGGDRLETDSPYIVGVADTVKDEVI